MGADWRPGRTLDIYRHSDVYLQQAAFLDQGETGIQQMDEHGYLLGIRTGGRGCFGGRISGLDFQGTVKFYSFLRLSICGFVQESTWIASNGIIGYGENFPAEIPVYPNKNYRVHKEDLKKSAQAAKKFQLDKTKTNAIINT